VKSFGFSRLKTAVARWKTATGYSKVATHYSKAATGYSKVATRYLKVATDYSKTATCYSKAATDHLKIATLVARIERGVATSEQSIMDVIARRAGKGKCPSLCNHSKPHAAYLTPTLRGFKFALRVGIVDELAAFDFVQFNCMIDRFASMPHQTTDQGALCRQLS
jgi:hypothetical protein